MTEPFSTQEPRVSEVALHRRPMSRRELLRWSSLVAVGLGAGLPSMTVAAPRVMKARPADSVVEAMGARTATFEGAGSAYLDVSAVTDAFAYIGLRYARELGVLPSQNRTIANRQKAMWEALAAHGCRTLTRVGDPDGSSGSVSDFAAYHKAAWGSDVASVLWGVENGNEWNSPKFGPGIGSGSSSRTGRNYSPSYPLWAEQLAVWQRRISRHYGDDRLLQQLVLVGPPIAGAADGLYADAETLADVCNQIYGGRTGMAPHVTHNSFHLYPGGASAMHKPSVPSWQLDNKVGAARTLAAHRPVICTEMGVHNAIADRAGMSAHSEKAGGIYAPRMTLENLYRGVKRHFYFELVDDYNNPARDNRESNFGLFHHDWTPKPAAVAWRNLARLFRDPGPAFTRTDARISVSSADPTLRTMLFQKRDGTNLLTFWRDISVYDYETRRDLKIPRRTINVTLETRSRVRVFNPSLSSAPRHDYGRVTSFPVHLRGGVVVAEIT